MSHTPERRRQSRTSFPHRPEAVTRQGEAIRVVNLSSAGVRIQHRYRMTVGTDCPLHLPVGFGPADRVGNVVWCRPLTGHAPFWYESGLEFKQKAANAA